MSKSILMVIAPEQFRDEELMVPRDIFVKEGFSVDTVSTRVGRCVGMLGAVEDISKSLDSVEAATQQGAYSAVVVVGGMGSPQHLWDNTQLHRLLETMVNQGKVVASICLSGVVLAKAGLLKQKKATVWESPDSLEQFTTHQVHYTGESVTVDGQLITANGPEAADAFACQIVTVLSQLAAVNQ